MALKPEFEEVWVVMTPSATEFLPARTVRLVADQVQAEFFEVGEACNHVRLAEWADLFIVWPATANVLGQVAGGMAANLLTATVLAHSKPVLFFPHMNRSMYEKAAVQRNIGQIRDDGHWVCELVESLGFVEATREWEVHPGMPSIEQSLHLIVEEAARRREGALTHSPESL